MRLPVGGSTETEGDDDSISQELLLDAGKKKRSRPSWT
jgi:hypothetical protein